MPLALTAAGRSHVRWLMAEVLPDTIRKSRQG
jgi:hypothetical protein